MSGTESVDENFMAVLGTNQLSAFFYDCVDQSIMIRIGIFLQSQMPRLLQTITGLYFRNAWEVIQCIVSMSIRYSDLPKDILFLYIIWLRLENYGPRSFPIAIFWILLSSIIATETLHCFTIMTRSSTLAHIGRKTLTLFLTPLMPALYLYKYLKFKLTVQKLRRRNINNQHVDNKIENCELKCLELQLLNAEMQCTENVLENFIQFTILIIMISLSKTATRTVENIEAIFVGKNELLGYILAAFSFVSIVRGQLAFLKASKNGCLGLKGTLLVVPYFALGTCSR